MIPRNNPHFIEIERNGCAHAWASPPYYSGIRCAPFTGVENPFRRGMQIIRVVLHSHYYQSYTSLIL
jgi:hypothetical protein